MRGLLAQELLYIWETGLQQHLVDRALTILAMALPEMPRNELLALSVGQRDAQLLAIRERTFGSQLAGFAECPACQERLGFVFDAADILAMQQIEDGTGSAIINVNKFSGIAEHPSKADKSAVGAINRPLHCHPERSKGSGGMGTEMLRFAQHDSIVNQSATRMTGLVCKK